MADRGVASRSRDLERATEPGDRTIEVAGAGTRQVGLDHEGGHDETVRQARDPLPHGARPPHLPPNDCCLVAVTSTPTGGISIQGSTFTARVAASDLPVSIGALDAAVGFTVHGDAGCGTGLGVRLRL